MSETFHPQSGAETEKLFHRRKFLEFLSASPVVAPGMVSALAGLSALGTDAAMAQSYDVLRQSPGNVGEIIDSPSQALNVFDFEPAAKKALPPAHYGYLASGVDGDETLKANRAGFEKIRIRARRLIDVRKIDTTVKIFGETWASPIMLAPVSSQAAFHPEAESAVARGAKVRVTR